MKKLHNWLLRDGNCSVLMVLPFILLLFFILESIHLLLPIYLMILLLVVSFGPLWYYSKLWEPKPSGLDVSILRKIKTRWRIIHFHDPVLAHNKTIKEGELIYRALYDGKHVDFAWHQDKITLIKILAYCEVYGRKTILDRYVNPDEEINRRFRTRFNAKRKDLRNRLIKKQIPVWP